MRFKHTIYPHLYNQQGVQTSLYQSVLSTPGTSVLCMSHAMGYTVPSLSDCHRVANTKVPLSISVEEQNHLSHGFPNVSPFPAGRASMKFHWFVDQS